MEKVRDKRLDAEPTVNDLRRRRGELTDRHYEGNVRLKGEFAKRHKKRIQQLAEKVERDEKLMQQEGINPTRPASASKFDRLVGKNGIMPQ